MLVWLFRMQWAHTVSKSQDKTYIVESFHICDNWVLGKGEPFPLNPTDVRYTGMNNDQQHIDTFDELPESNPF